MSGTYTIDENNPMLSQVNKEETTAIEEVNNMYDGMVTNTDSFFTSQIDAVDNYGTEQKTLQQEQTDLTIEQIEQQKEEAKKDYEKEQSAAYTDWQKQSNAYGVNAEMMAANGMSNSGYSESSQVSMYNTYQNRVMAAREVYKKAELNYDNAIKEARLQNSVALAEIAFNTLQTKLQLALEGFQYKNTLLSDKANMKLQVKQMYENKKQNTYQNLLEQIELEAMYPEINVDETAEPGEPAAPTEPTSFDFSQVYAAFDETITSEEIMKLIDEGVIKETIDENGKATYTTVDAQKAHDYAVQNGYKDHMINRRGIDGSSLEEERTRRNEKLSSATPDNPVTTTQTDFNMWFNSLTDEEKLGKVVQFPDGTIKRYERYLTKPGGNFDFRWVIHYKTENIKPRYILTTETNTNDTKNSSGSGSGGGASGQISRKSAVLNTETNTK